MLKYCDNIPACRQRQVNGEQEKYLSTQHERDVETGLDYRGARFYDSDVGRFLSLDPLAAEYPSLSDYCYVAGNPVMYIDPDGRKFTPSSEKYITDLKSTINNKLVSIQKSKEKFADMWSEDDLKELNSITKELNEALTELTELESSDQLYDIQYDEGMEEGTGLTTYENNTVVIRFNSDIGTVGHELKHAFQFEKGKLSFYLRKDGSYIGGGTYDIADEYEGYKRGHAIGGKTITKEDISIGYNLQTFRMEGVDNSTTIGELFFSDKMRFKLIFGSKPKKTEYKKTVGELMEQQNSENNGKQQHVYKEQK